MNGLQPFDNEFYCKNRYGVKVIEKRKITIKIEIIIMVTRNSHKKVVVMMIL